MLGNLELITKRKQKANIRKKKLTKISIGKKANAYQVKMGHTLFSN